MENSTETDYLGIPGARKVSVETGEGRLAYVKAGAGPVVILVHGLGTASETWFRSIGKLAERYTVIAPDLPGHGASQGPRVLTRVEPLVRGMEALRDALGLERFALVGHSLGGLVVLRYALDHPDRVSKLALVDAGGIGREMSWLARLARLPCVGWLVFVPASFIVRTSGKFVYDPPGDVRVSFLKLLHRSHLNHATADVVRHAVERSAERLGPEQDDYLLPRMNELHIPVTVIWGQQDTLFPVNQLEGIRRVCPNVEVHMLADVGHWPYAEVPNEFNALLAHFLAEGEGW